MTQENKCRRCSKSIEEIKNCGGVNCPYWNPRDLNRPSIKKDLDIQLLDKYFVENLCNSCSDKFEDVLNVFYNCKIGAKSIKKLEEESQHMLNYNIEGGQEEKHTHDAKFQIIKVWEGDKIWEFDLKKENLESILNLMGF